MAQAGDYSLYQKLYNLTDEQVVALKAAYDRANASYSGGGSSGTSYYSGSSSSGNSGQNVILGKSGTYTDEEIQELKNKGYITEYRTSGGTTYYKYGSMVPTHSANQFKKDVKN